MRRRFSAGRRSIEIEIETTWNCWRMNSVCVARGKADLRLSAAALHFSSLRHVGLLRWLPRAQDFQSSERARGWRLVGQWDTGMLLSQGWNCRLGPNLHMVRAEHLMVMGCEVLHSPVSRPTAPDQTIF